MAGARTHPLTRDEILARALEIADAEGLEKLTMRRLARDLGVEAMTLYHHFAGKDAILDGIAARVLDEMVIDGPLPEDWMDTLVEMCVSFRHALGNHPNVITLLMTRPLNPPEAATTSPVAVLAGAGFDPAEMLEMYQALMALTFGHAVVTAASAAAGQDSSAGSASAAGDDAGFKRAVRILIAGYAAQATKRQDRPAGRTGGGRSKRRDPGAG